MEKIQLESYTPVAQEKDELIKLEALAASARRAGYQGLSVHIGRERMRTELVAALAMLGVKPFTPESVARYEKRERRRAIWEARGVVVGIGLALVALGLPAPLLLTGKAWFVIVPSIISMLVALAGSVVTLGGLFFPNIGYEWRTISLSRYTEPMPFAVIELMLKLQQHVPNANFGVRVLAEKERWDRYEDDPFLLVSVGDLPPMAIAVWDEPRFR